MNRYFMDETSRNGFFLEQTPWPEIPVDTIPMDELFVEQISMGEAHYEARTSTGWDLHWPRGHKLFAEELHGCGGTKAKLQVPPGSGKERDQHLPTTIHPIHGLLHHCLLLRLFTDPRASPNPTKGAIEEALQSITLMLWSYHH
ncbi:hypothetical protein AAES_30995 [Amazona aestiva]|uniref:Uncharacterized protein n=1 Tax=Amazona aestiva TaxID=12930 RepID=A0A0Q3RPC4_AMAAE|nr:hypothetical protein AAES_30995 [Amazona aestiva]